jgi:hypothetical protein
MLSPSSGSQDKPRKKLLATSFTLVSCLAYFSTLKMEAAFLRNVGWILADYTSLYFTPLYSGHLWIRWWIFVFSKRPEISSTWSTVSFWRSLLHGTGTACSECNVAICILCDKFARKVRMWLFCWHFWEAVFFHFVTMTRGASSWRTTRVWCAYSEVGPADSHWYL